MSVRGHWQDPNLNSRGEAAGGGSGLEWRPACSARARRPHWHLARNPTPGAGRGVLTFAAYVACLLLPSGACSSGHSTSRCHGSVTVLCQWRVAARRSWAWVG